MKVLLFLSVLLSSCFASMPNIKFPTLGGMQFWDDVQIVNGHKIQQHVWTKHYRLLDEDNWRLAWGSLTDCERLLPKVNGKDRVVILLLHGMGRSHFSMMALRNKLQSKGYQAECVSYSSMLSQRKVFAKNLNKLIQRSPYQNIYVVTHSLGGVVLRDYARDYDTSKIVGALTLAAPHQGSVIVDSLAKLQLHYLLGSTGYSLRSKQLADENLDLSFNVETVGGVAKSFPYLPFGVFLGKDSDGIVLNKNSRLNGYKHHTVNVSHTFIMNHQRVLELIEESLVRF